MLYPRNDSLKSNNIQVVKDSRLIDFIVAPGSYQNQVSQLPNLTALRWPQEKLASHPAGRKDENGTIVPLPKAFEPVMSRGQRTLSKHLLKVFSDIMFQQGWGNRWMLYGGTLLGSFRHHDYIPWDDDTDVMVDMEIRSQLDQILKSLEPDYRLTMQGKRDKFYAQLLNTSKLGLDNTDPELSRKSSQYSWGWPYLDIGFYVKNETEVCELAWSYGKNYCWPQDVIFPVIFRPLGEYWFPTPYMILKFLVLTYGTLDYCVQYGYSHVLESGGPSGNSSCEQLATRYAFVQQNQLMKLFKMQMNSSESRKCLFVEESLTEKGPNNVSHVYHKLRLPQII